ncbi:hypothetical protein [Crateriforma spongiae]|uniref:hypothetical protein n=1 Tax=Crateriforma spongiae TaxID=2724528 RepID=UPI001445B6A8|nr:hypothetical protein [Crateriforma spongiae]
MNVDKLRLYASNPAAFRDELVVDVDGTPRRLGDVADPWQRDDYKLLDPLVMACLGRGKRPETMRAFFERPRGHSKTTDIAVVVTYMLAFATRPLRLYAYAADKDQAMLLRDAILTLTRLNPWLGAWLQVDRARVTNVSDSPGYDSYLAIETSDVGSSYGILPDAIVFDEITHWGDSSEALWASLISSAAKRRNCLMFGIANAGWQETWQWKLRESIRSDSSWIFRRLNGPEASWMTEDRLDEQRRLLPGVSFARLWLNEWSTGGGDALTSEDIEAAFDGAAFPIGNRLRGYTCVAGVDLGVKRDASAVAVLGIGENDTPNAKRFRLLHTKRWKPRPGKTVDLMDVEQELRRCCQVYGLDTIAYDPWQAELLAQRLSYDLRRVDLLPVVPSGANLRDMASRLIEAFTDRRVTLYEDRVLRHELVHLRIEERSFGFRLVSPRDETGHGDLASAFVNALYVGFDIAGRKARPTVSMF